MIPVITIEGATATGKSAFAIELASLLNTEIISADSRQVYRYMDIGTAKVSYQERQRVTHHLVDIIDPNETYNAGQFCSDAKARIMEMRSRGLVPIICGGTGLYVRSLLQGLCELPIIPSEIRNALERRLQCEGLPVLYQELCGIDPLAASKISINDPQRTLRALEVYHATGVPLSEHWRSQTQESTFAAFRICLNLDRSELYARINNRMKEMLDMGLLAELRELLNMGYGECDPGLKCMGYKEYIPHLQGLQTLDNAMDIASQHQRNLAKRQLTWYRKCSFDLTLDAHNISLSDVSKTIKDYLIEANNADYSQSTGL